MENMRVKSIKEMNLEWCKKNQRLILNYQREHLDLIDDPLKDEDKNFLNFLKRIDDYE